MTNGSGQSFAVFDIDGTVAREGLMLGIASKLERYGRLSEPSAAAIESAYEDWRKRRRPDAFALYVQACVVATHEALKGLKVSAYEEIVDGVIADMGEHFYLYTTALIKELRAAGYMILAISGSEQRSLARFCRRHGFDDWVGSDFYERDGRFTGLSKNAAQGKGRILSGLIEKHHLCLKGSVAVGDTAGDIGMLEMVERPICFNPNSELKDIALARGWETVIERKDVIYTLRPRAGDFILETTDVPVRPPNEGSL